MALEMKTACMKCDGGLENMGEAWICSYECTFCTPCTADMKNICPNCGGELLRRPRRQPRD
ncbi:MAG: DUF1272 domain-containing protein [Alphaproteobacteria bacterium]|nr:DUF1272 domain-containing protein [Alphaproteobacteria bacterium]